MINISFDPFESDFEKLKPNDLSVLRNVAEGWYVEYKGELVNTKNIAKSLSAFANHYGGWIFYGIKGAKDGSNVAEGFPGLDKHEVAIIIENIRNAAKDVINPHPYYEYTVLKGPCSEIGLSDEKSIVVVTVPSGPDTPYIHSDGRIYRRIADSSDPKAETDRFTLDHLWQRGQRARDKLASFLENKLILSGSEIENEVCFIDLFFLPDPLGASGQHTQLKFDRFVELMSDKTAPGLSLVYDNFYTMSDGFIARDVNINNPYNLTATWRHFGNGFSIVSMPFSSAEVGGLKIGGWLHGYEQERVFLQMIKKKNYTYSHILDINQLIFSVIAAFGQQKRLMEEGKIKGPLYAKAVIHNVWRKIPFLDTEAYIQFVQKHGLPVIQFRDEFIPPDKTFDSLVLISEEILPETNNNPVAAQTLQALPILIHIGNTLGLPVEIGIKNTEEWWSAGQRTPDVSKWRFTTFS